MIQWLLSLFRSKSLTQEESRVVEDIVSAYKNPSIAPHVSEFNAKSYYSLFVCANGLKYTIWHTLNNKSVTIESEKTGRILQQYGKRVAREVRDRLRQAKGTI